MSADGIALLDGGLQAGRDNGSAYRWVGSTPNKRIGLNSILVRIGYKEKCISYVKYTELRLCKIRDYIPVFNVEAGHE